MITEISELRSEVGYYKKLVDEVAGLTFIMDSKLSLLKRDLNQKKDAFSFLLALHQVIGSNLDIDTFFTSTLQKLGSILWMDKSLILWKDNPGNHEYVIRYHHGYSPAESASFNSQKIDLTLLNDVGNPNLLVNKSTHVGQKEDILQKVVLLPFFLAVPVTYKDEVLAWLITGREKEAFPFYLMLNNGDIETAQVIAGFIEASVSIIQYQKKMLAYVKEKQQIEAYFQQELLQSRLEIQEQTFKTISQEIHDNIGQMLSLARLHLNTIDLKKEEKATEKIFDAKDLISKAIRDLRDLSKTLNADTIADIGLMRAIEMELQLLRKTGLVQTKFQLVGLPIKLDPQKELILFRIFQEALHNIIKHSQATAISIKAYFEDNFLQLFIEDNGNGFSAEETIYQTGSGLRNMKSRSQLIGAHFEITSHADIGTTIKVSLPID